MKSGYMLKLQKNGENKQWVYDGWRKRFGEEDFMMWGLKEGVKI